MAIAATHLPGQSRGTAAIVYPDSDGQPTADNTLQFEWIVTIKENLETLFADRDDVFVAGDLLWYPVEGHPEIRVAPDTLVAFDRPKGYRGSYRQWEEGGTPPQVVFEILSPGNRLGEMARKLGFYDRHGVEEYYLYDPDHDDLAAWRRGASGLESVESVNGYISPRLGIRFVLPENATLQIFGPNGERFLTFVELARERDRAAAERDQAITDRDAASERAERLAAQLRALGVDPDTL